MSRVRGGGAFRISRPSSMSENDTGDLPDLCICHVAGIKLPDLSANGGLAKAIVWVRKAIEGCVKEIWSRKPEAPLRGWFGGSASGRRLSATGAAILHIRS